MSPHCPRSRLLPTALLALAAALPVARGQTLLINADFNQSAVLGPGQSVPAAGVLKLISTASGNPDYASAISGITGWTYALPGWDGSWVGTWSDHGLCLPTGVSNGDGTQAAFINNWQRTMSQTAGAPIAANTVITATFNFGTLCTPSYGRAGTFFLIAGAMDPANPDALASGATVLASLTIANAAFAGSVTPDAIGAFDTWGTYSVSYTVSASDPLVGKSLTVAFRTLNDSSGPTYWDNINLSFAAVPEPNSFILLGTGLLVLGLIDVRRTRGL
jgi:hypothetical protein